MRNGDYSWVVGETVTFTKQVSEADAALFLLVTREDDAPAEDPVKPVRRPREAAPFGLLAALLASAAVRHLPQPELASFRHQEISFSAPAYTEDTLSAVARLTAYDSATQTLHIHVLCDNQDGLRLAEGTFALSVE